MKFCTDIRDAHGRAVMRRAAGGNAVSYFDAGKVAAALSKGTTLVSIGSAVMGGHREAPGQVEVHAKETATVSSTSPGRRGPHRYRGTVDGGKQKGPRPDARTQHRRRRNPAPRQGAIGS